MRSVRVISYQSIVSLSAWRTSCHERSLHRKSVSKIGCCSLASTLLQLQSTPWLANSWSKRIIEFLKRPASAVVSAQASALAQAATAYHSATNVIDYQHPVISQSFSTSAQFVHLAASLPPKEALLELGIMLLGHWHETTLETFYRVYLMGKSGTPMPVDYWSRFMLASCSLLCSSTILIIKLSHYFTQPYRNV
jgi:hypothetical protein